MLLLLLSSRLLLLRLQMVLLLLLLQVRRQPRLLLLLLGQATADHVLRLHSVLAMVAMHGRLGRHVAIQAAGAGR